MEAANGDRHALLAKLTADIERAGELIRLDADQSDHSAVCEDASRNGWKIDDGVALIVDLEFDVDLGAENLGLSAFPQQSVDAGQAVRRDGRAPPLDDIAVVVVMRRLDQHDREPALGHQALMGGLRPVISSSKAASALERPGQLQIGEVARPVARRFDYGRIALIRKRRKYELRSRTV